MKLSVDLEHEIVYSDEALADAIRKVITEAYEREIRKFTKEALAKQQKQLKELVFANANREWSRVKKQLEGHHG